MTDDSDRLVRTHPALADYRDHLDTRTRAEGVDTNALWYPVRQFHAWCDSRGISPLHPLVTDLQTFVGAPRRDGGPAAPATRAGRRSSLAYFYDHVRANDPNPPANPARSVKPPAPGPVGKTRVLSPLQIEAMIAAVDATTYASPVRTRDRALIRLMGVAALRPKTLRTARRADADLTDPDYPLVHVAPIKGGRGRPHRLDADTAAVLADWLRVSPARHRAAPLLPNTYGGPLATRAIARVVHRVAEAAGVSDSGTVTPNVLRASAGVHASRGGAPLHAVQDLYGHASAATTSRYLSHVDDSGAALDFMAAYRRQWMEDNAVAVPGKR